MKRRVLSFAICVLLLLTTALSVSAAESGSITVLFRHEDRPVAGATFSVFKAAEWNDSGYSLVAPFSGYAVRMADDPNSDDWKALASTLSAYAARDGIEPLTSGQTDENGNLRFDGLSDGLYLVVGSPASRDDLRFFPQPMLVSVPFVNADGAEDREVVTSPKYEFRKVTDETVQRRALKVWKDDGNERDRPQEITVQLLCDGEVYDEQTLNADNHWSCTWDGLDAEKDWQLTEKEVPAAYTVQITQQDITFTVVNTDKNPPPSSSTTSEPPLPPTGLLWWPIPVLGGIGAVALFVGIFLLLRKKDNPNA